MRTRLSIIETFLVVWNTLVFNYKVFGVRACIRPKVYVGPYAKFGSLYRGSVEIYSNEKVLIGVGVGSFMRNRLETTFINIGPGAVIKVRGNIRFCRGCKINLSENAVLDIGRNFRANANCVFSVTSVLKIADDVHIGWDCEILDGDGHTLKASNADMVLNNANPIIIESNVWIGARSAILKGVQIKHDVVIPYGSVIVKSCDSSNVVFGGEPNRVLKKGISIIF